MLTGWARLYGTLDVGTQPLLVSSFDHVLPSWHNVTPT